MSETINLQNSSDCSPHCWCKLKNKEKEGFVKVVGFN